MSTPDLQQIKDSLLDAGIEIYRTRDSELHIAERVRLHIMDSGVRVHSTQQGLAVEFTARSQRSDFPNIPPEDLFQKVREAVGATARDRGYEEASADTVEVKDPVDDSKVLDVWHEVSFRRLLSSSDEAVEEVRWALDVEKYVTA